MTSSSTTRGRTILLCIPSMNGGGAERQLAYLATGLTELGWTVHVALCAKGVNYPRLVASGASIHLLHTSSSYDPRLLSGLVGVISRVRPDLVHTWLPQMDIAAGIAAALTRRPQVISERASKGAYVGDWKDRLRARLANRSRYVIANSALGADYWRARIAPDRVGVISNAVPREEIAAAVMAAGHAQTPELVLFAGRYATQKNLGALLRALRIAADQRPRLKAIFYGHGDLEQELRELRASLDLDEVVAINGETTELWSEMARCSVFISVSLFEGNPNTVLEAIAARCHLVVSDIPEHREFLTEDAVRFVSPQDPEAIATGILDVLENPGAAGARAARAERLLGNRSIRAVAERYAEVYQGIVTGTKSTRDAERSR